MGNLRDRIVQLQGSRNHRCAHRVLPRDGGDRIEVQQVDFRKTELLAPLTWITPTIRERLREYPGDNLATEHSGEGVVFGVEYRFHASLVRSGAPPPRFDVDAAEFIEYAPRFGLYDVELELEREGEKSRFVYQELAWQPLVNLEALACWKCWWRWSCCPW